MWLWDWRGDVDYRWPKEPPPDDTVPLPVGAFSAGPPRLLLTAGLGLRTTDERFVLLPLTTFFVLPVLPCGTDGDGTTLELTGWPLRTILFMGMHL